MTAVTRRRRSPRTASGLLGPMAMRGVVLLAVLYFLVPVLWLGIASTKSSGDLYTTPGFQLADWRLWENLVALFTYGEGIYLRWIGNSVVYSVVGAVASTLISAACGYALAIYEFRGRRILMGALVASLLIPATVLAQPIYLLLVQLGLNNTMLGVLLPGLPSPFGVMLCYLAVRSSVPVEIVEAARIDGAGEVRIFFTMALSLMRTGLTTVMLFAFIGSWNSFLLPLLVLDDAALFPVTVGLVDWSQQSASVAQLGTLTIVGAFVSIVPIVVAFIALQRHWRAGLTAGAVKM